MESSIDQHARDIAAEARSRIIAHEDVCAVRWGHASQSINEIRDAVQLQTRQMWVANGMVITALLGLIWWLGNHAFR